MDDPYTGRKFQNKNPFLTVKKSFLFYQLENLLVTKYGILKEEKFFGNQLFLTEQQFLLQQYQFLQFQEF